MPQLSPEIVARIYPSFVSTVYDSLVGPTAGTIPSFRHVCEKLWPRFVAPIICNEKPPGLDKRSEWDFSRLLVRNRALFQQEGEAVLVHHIVSDDPSSTPTGASNNIKNAITTSAPPSLAKKNLSSPLLSLPYLPTLILTSAFLASYIPARLDTIFFSKFSTSLAARKKRAYHCRHLKITSQLQSQTQGQDHLEDISYTTSKHAKKPRSGTKITKPALRSAMNPHSSSAVRAAGFTKPHPFPLERLLAIYHAIDPSPSLSATPAATKPLADVIYPELATLQRLRLLVPVSASAAAGGAGADGVEKWCLNASGGVESSPGALEGEWIIEMAKGIGVDVEEWLGGGLD
jgi:origin recognition complex subunit 5